MPDVTKVSTGKPKIAGGVYRAPAGTTLPTDATTSLASAFLNLGYVSEDGVTNTYTNDSESIHAWGGTTVMVVSTDKTDDWKFVLLESLNENVLKTIFGDSNVTVSDGAIAISAKGEYAADSVYVIDMRMNTGVMKRVVIPIGSIKELGDIVYVDNEPVGYELTVAALADSTGVNHYEYFSAPTETTGT